MQQYAVVVENDITQWEDQTGSRYHFPKRYARFLTPGTRLIHYKGRLRDPRFLPKRLSPEPHYFAFSIAGEHTPDPDSDKGDLFVDVLQHRPFDEAVPHRIDGETLETIPESRKDNFWRDGVRPATLSLFETVGRLARIVFDEGETEVTEDIDLTTTMQEGGKKIVYGTRYERRPELRALAIKIHGTVCFACEADLEKVYGELAAGYIQIHHKRPLYVSGPTIVNAETDLVPLCPNCHGIAHLGNKLRSVNDIRSLLGKPAVSYGD
ncbi:HNH endonuclease [Phyllobacterium zundukense]|uniref:Restriction endonuclease n=1 Tax=Phyllobacterium zundukense TaxID=1867719 RepID=A0A2N9VW35_9HYPH|nr:restriction endonuclease [Phyllobacterium zundukense]ATU91436.1 hypothetical protein BLM14_07170 [Phyllobacterium zundukense]PIO43703.1 hypothetical protein B5P45_17555 [Phyllobacterium zundukense]